MILDATKAETDALLDLLDKANRAHGLSTAYWAFTWAMKIKDAEAKEKTKVVEKAKLEVVKKPKEK